MIDARITKKITSACKHDLPVVISCLECMEGELKMWEARIRDDHHRSLSDEWRFMVEQVKGAREQTSNLQDTNDRLGRTIAKLESERKRLIEANKEMQLRINNMSAQLHAEQAAKTKFPVLVEKAAE